jgi:hypothetical protein
MNYYASTCTQLNLQSYDQTLIAYAASLLIEPLFSYYNSNEPFPDLKHRHVSSVIEKLQSIEPTFKAVDAERACDLVQKFYKYFPEFDFGDSLSFEVEPLPLKKGYGVIISGNEINTYSPVGFIRACLNEFYLSYNVVMQVAYSASAMEVDAFRGAAFSISKDSVIEIDTVTWSVQHETPNPNKLYFVQGRRTGEEDYANLVVAKSEHEAWLKFLSEELDADETEIEKEEESESIGLFVRTLIYDATETAYKFVATGTTI